MKVRTLALGLSLFGLTGCGPELAAFLSGVNQGLSTAYSSPRFTSYTQQQAYLEAQKSFSSSLAALASGISDDKSDASISNDYAGSSSSSSYRLPKW